MKVGDGFALTYPISSKQSSNESAYKELNVKRMRAVEDSMVEDTQWVASFQGPPLIFSACARLFPSAFLGWSTTSLLTRLWPQRPSIFLHKSFQSPMVWALSVALIPLSHQ